jgi:XRE family transcriptional regulator, regulator of sulfur utilization
MIDVESLGQRLKQLRELKGSSLSALAGQAGVSKSYLAKLERGEIENPGLQTLQVISSALKITLADLLAPASMDAPAPSSAAGSEVAEYERLLADLPSGLGEFLAAKETEGERLPADMIRSLAAIQFRGKRPQAAADWRFLYDAIRRSL